MNIFIGSSKESLSEAKYIARTIEELGHTPKLWKNSDIFIAGRYTLENLEHIARGVDAAIFVFNEDDKTWYRDDFIPTVRDNVLFEYGLFCGHLSKNNVCFCCNGKPKISSDLVGITYIDVKNKNHAEEDICQLIERLSCNEKNLELNSGRIISICLNLESCEKITIDTKFIDVLLINSLKYTISRIAINYVSKSLSCDDFVVSIYNKFNLTNWTVNGLVVSQQPPFERINEFKDIASITVIYEKGLSETILVPWNSEVDDDHNNRLQKCHIDIFGNMYIVISKNKSIIDYFEIEKLDLENSFYYLELFDYE